MTLALRYAARTDVGLLREGNEDAMYAGPRLLAVADGMGGHAAGEVASRVVIETVAALDSRPPADGELTAALRGAVETANDYLRDMVAADSALEGMGTTLTALLWVGQQLGLVHVGDSRAYLFRDGQLQLITHDHTLVQNLIDDGRITPDEATTHPQRSWITRALDGRGGIEPDVSMRDVRPGDRYLICSDGLSSYVTEETIAETLAVPDVDSACNQLVDLALRAGGPDNVTCIVADLVEDDAASAEPIVGGAAAEPAHSDPEPAAAAAPDQTDAPPRPVAPPPADTPTTATADPSRGGGRRVAIVLGAVIVLAGLAALATFLYIRTQYYVAVSADSSPTVAVYRGVSGSIVGIDLSRLDAATDLPISALPDYEQPKVADGIQASSESDAQRIVGRLRTEACDDARQRAEATAPRRHRDDKPLPLPSYCPEQS